MDINQWDLELTIPTIIIDALIDNFGLLASKKLILIGTINARIRRTSSKQRLRPTNQLSLVIE
jgi:hypothetical protein